MIHEEVAGAKFVVIGGGTGSFAVLSGLKNYVQDITAIVDMADDGGSTGQLRDELGALPPGDVRQCLVALSDSPKVRDLFNYRFEEGTMKGHAFGNLFLSALEKMTGNFAEAVELASEVLNITGKVEPMTLTDVTLCVEGQDGKMIVGEDKIGRSSLARCPKVELRPAAVANPRAIQAILEADMVVIAPGDLYESIAPVLVVPGVGEALTRTKAVCVYVCNLVTKPHSTHSLKVHDFAAEIERLAGGDFLDYVVFNSALPNKALLDKYAHDGELSVEADIDTLKKQQYQYRGVPLLSGYIWQNNHSSDALSADRSYIRHDPDAIARQLMRIYFT